VGPQLQLPAQPEDDLPSPPACAASAHSGAAITTNTAISRKGPGGRSRGARTQSRPRHRLQHRPRYFAVLPAGFAAGAAAFVAACAGAAFFAGSFFAGSFFAGSFFAGAFFAADGTASASAVRSTTESSPPKSLATQASAAQSLSPRWPSSRYRNR